MSAETEVTRRPLSRDNYWKQLLKKCIWHGLSSHRPGHKKDIFLYANRRGGSTLLMQAIAANRGVRYVDQPFSIYTASRKHSKYLPECEMGQLVALDAGAEMLISKLINLLHEGTLRVNGPWRFWQPGFHFRTDRLVLKITDAKGIIDWIDSHFNIHTVYITRHPIACAQSIIRNRWGLTAEAYLNDSSFVAQYLTPSIEAYCWKILNTGSEIEKHVLNWALENLIPFRLLPHRNHWLYLSFEETVLSPRKTMTRLAKNLELDCVDRMVAAIMRPSLSTKRFSEESVRKAILNQRLSPEDLINHWKSQIPENQQKAAWRVLNTLNIDLYEEGELLPRMSTR